MQIMTSNGWRPLDGGRMADFWADKQARIDRALAGISAAKALPVPRDGGQDKHRHFAILRAGREFQAACDDWHGDTSV